MTYILLTDEQLAAQEKQDKLDLDLFKKVTRKLCKSMPAIYKLLSKGANPMRIDGDIIKQCFNQSSYGDGNLEFLAYCYENYTEVQDYIHNKLDLNIALRLPAIHLKALEFLITKTERNLTEQERIVLLAPLHIKALELLFTKTERTVLENKNSALFNRHHTAIEMLKQSLEKRDLFEKMKAKHQAIPVKKAQQQKMKI